MWRGSMPFRRTVAKPVAKPLERAQCTWKTLEYRPTVAAGDGGS